MPDTLIYFVETRANEKHQLLCHVVEHFYEKRKNIQIVAGSMKASEDLDNLLWTFSKTSLIPHRILGPDHSNSVNEPAVVITEDERPLENYEILVYDGMMNLEFIKSYLWVVHFIIMNDPGKRKESRNLYKSARDQGFQLQHIPYSPLREITTLLEKLDR
jgi:DNA polymerase IIIc chi subunit